MQDMGLGLQFSSRMTNVTPANAAAGSHERMNGSTADGDLDFEPPSLTAEDFRKKFMDIHKSARLHAG